MFALDDKVALVTGGASGIGLEIAERLTEAGATVVVADLEGADRTESGHLAFVEVDVRDEQQVASAMKRAAEIDGRIDICVNNAGIGTEASFEETSREAMEANFATNTLGTFFGMKHVAPFMPRGGAIVNTASVAGLIGLPGSVAYGASKWAIVGLTRIAAVEYGQKGIRVNCVCPSSVDTPMLAAQEHGEAEVAVMQAAAPIKGVITPAQVAAAVHFLVADDCPVISGHALTLDGGATAGLSVDLVDLACRAAGVTPPDDDQP